MSSVKSLPIVNLPYPKNSRLSALDKEIHAEHARYMFALMEGKRAPFEKEQHFNRKKELRRVHRKEKKAVIRQQKEKNRQDLKVFTNVGTWADFAARRSSDSGNGSSDSDSSSSPAVPQQPVGFAMPQLVDPSAPSTVIPFSRRRF